MKLNLPEKLSTENDNETLFSCLQGWRGGGVRATLLNADEGQRCKGPGPEAGRRGTEFAEEPARVAGGPIRLSPLDLMP